MFFSFSLGFRVSDRTSVRWVMHFVDNVCVDNVCVEPGATEGKVVYCK
jgi:hypothetical protein